MGAHLDARSLASREGGDEKTPTLLGALLGAHSVGSHKLVTKRQDADIGTLLGAQSLRSQVFPFRRGSTEGTVPAGSPGCLPGCGAAGSVACSAHRTHHN